MPEENEHTRLEDPEAKYYKTKDAWYVEIVTPHPVDETQPPQSMTCEVPDKWWAEFIAALVNELPTQSWNDIINGEIAAEFGEK